MLVGEYVEHRLTTGEIVATSAVTIRPMLRQWHTFAGPVDGWTTDLAAAWVHDPALRPNSRKGRMSRLRPYIGWLVRTDRLERDITVGIPKVKIPPPSPRDMRPGEVSALLAAAPDDRARLIVLLMAQCGLRCVDVSRVRIEDIDVHRQLLDVRAKGGRGEVTHTVPIPGELWSTLVPFVQQSGRATGPLVCAENRLEPTPISANRLSVLVRWWIRDAGLKVFPHDGRSPHALRHTCAQHMLDAGAEVRDVQFTLGHRHLSTTETYLRREPSGLREAMEGRTYLRAA